MEAKTVEEKKTITAAQPSVVPKTEVVNGMIRLDVVKDGKSPSKVKVVQVDLGKTVEPSDHFRDGKIIETFINPSTGGMIMVIGSYY
ncbi:MAG TPA: hypothetical protein VK675_04130 [Candidatus Paceibacterota bacterium]|nr:hypothetical protein [Candidatus Paceibacterota bacterium]